ncbi:hypothetical protein [Bradyrhizobium sp. ARR65]|uniref:hypothetical protein n=1 Tax=Bradyrhizobium sp. ARR65 TaxID=1040989 RepID=UPI0012FCD17C|nr:hypothetical protein [Bradyrhizobium sp. ARR65]
MDFAGATAGGVDHAAREPGGAASEQGKNCEAPRQLALNRRQAPPNACDDGHWIEEILADGQILELEDGSLWKVNPTDTPISSVWLPVSDVFVCEDKIMNIDERETVQVERIR